ncbi:MAG: aldehyde dehydrogenase family protein [Gammaproteobacteria bacterium]|nr:aldehyde dehydrogenase family protein [Gammaproteobacteria bacterium]
MSRPAEAQQPAPAYILRNYIAGEWQEPGVELSHTVRNSNTGDPLLRQLGSTPVQIRQAIEAAETAHKEGVWCDLPGTVRARKLTEIANALEAIIDDMAEVDAIMTGVPIAHTRTIGRVCGAAFRAAAELAAESNVVRRETDFIVERLPLGPVAIIGPWNAPSGIACHKLASALAAGCTVLFKPSEWAPMSGQLIAQAIAELDLPPGVFQLLHGDGMTGAALVGDPCIAAVSFTGGLDAGRAVAASCAHQVKPAQLELGGNNPYVVLPGADLTVTVDGIIAALTTLNGQWCRALGRLIVHESLVNEIVETTMHRLGLLHVGHSTSHETEMGPLVHRLHKEHVEAAIERYREQGATILQSTPMPALAGWFVPPTLVTNISPDRTLDEIFGPVATVHAFSNIEEGIALANQTPYGLAAYVFGARVAAYDVARRLETGMVKVNSVTLFSPHPGAPRPAWKLSGIGDEGTRETFEFFRGTRVIGVPQGLPD